MAKNARDTRPKVKPVTQIELSEKNTTWRFVLLIVLLVIAAISFTIFLFSLFSKEDGWRTISPDTEQGSYNGEIALQYDLGKGKENATAEYKKLAALYGNALDTAYKSLTVSQSFVGFVNLRAVSDSINEELRVSPLLYSALKTMVQNGDRMLYMAPVYSLYANVFDSADDVIAAKLDPNKNGELFADVTAALEFINDPRHIDLELLDDDTCTLRLKVSEEYEAFLSEGAFDTKITLGVFELAFVVDYVGEVLAAEGYTRGIVTSYDGFTRSLGMDDESVSANVLDISEKRQLLTVGRINYTGELSSVQFRNFPIVDLDLLRFYTYEDGRTVSNWINPLTGKNANVIPTMSFYSKEKSCAQLALMCYGLYVSDVLDGGEINDLTARGIYTVYALDKTVFFNDERLKSDDNLEILLQGYNRAYLFE